MYTQRKFTRTQVADAISVTEPVRVGSDGCAAFSAFNFNTDSAGPSYYGVQFQMNISTSAGNPISAGWVGISNVGDERGQFGHGFQHPIGACVSGLPEGSFVRGHIYRLDGDASSYCYLAVRTSP